MRAGGRAPLRAIKRESSENLGQSRCCIPSRRHDAPLRHAAATSVTTIPHAAPLRDSHWGSLPGKVREEWVSQKTCRSHIAFENLRGKATDNLSSPFSGVSFTDTSYADDSGAPHQADAVDCSVYVIYNGHSAYERVVFVVRSFHCKGFLFCYDIYRQ